MTNRKWEIGFQSLGNKARLKIRILESSSMKLDVFAQEVGM